MKRLPLIIITLLVSVAIMAQTDSAQYYHELGRKAKDERRYMVADKYFSQSLRFNEGNSNVLMDQAAVQLEMKRLPQARATYEQVLAKDPNHKQALLALAELTFQLRHWPDAEKYARKCIDLGIGKSMSFRIAKSQYNQENYVEAAKYLEKASKEEPSNAEVPWMMGDIWIEMNNPKKALEMYEIALSIDPENGTWHYDLATLYTQAGDQKNALIHYEKAVAKNPNMDLNTLTDVGLAYLNNQQFDKGLEMINKVVAKKPMDKTLFNSVAYTFYRAKKFKDAIEWWDRILTIDKGDAKALYMIGVAYQKDGNKEKGSKLCDIAIELDPSLASMRKEMKMDGMGL